MHNGLSGVKRFGRDDEMSDEHIMSISQLSQAVVLKRERAPPNAAVGQRRGDS